MRSALLIMYTVYSTVNVCVCVCDVQLSAATDRINSLREEQEQLRQENATILETSQRKEEVRLRNRTMIPAVHCGYYIAACASCSSR